MGLASRQAEPSSFGWRWPIAFQGVFIVLILLALPFLPESPRWLVQHGRLEEAADVFARFGGRNAMISDLDIVKERDEVVASVEEERKLGQASWAEVFTEGKNRNISRVLLGAGPYMYKQTSILIYWLKYCSQVQSMVRNQLPRLFPSHHIRAQHRTLHRAFPDYRRRLGHPVFPGFMAVRYSWHIISINIY